MSDEDGEEIRINAYDENEQDEDEDNEELTEEQGFAAQPVEIVREEIVTVTKDPNTQEKISVVDDTRGDDDSDDLYELVRAHSVQLNKLTDIVESLQAQIKQLRETRKSSRKTTPTTRNPMKSKKKKASAKKAKGRSSKKSKT
jgi:Ni2+-binding GTPase involved in maturation of urease and hydrogenase